MLASHGSDRAIEEPCRGLLSSGVIVSCCYVIRPYGLAQCVKKAKCKGFSLPGSTPAGRPTEQARLAARSRSATARWIPGRVGADRYMGCCRYWSGGGLAPSPVAVNG